MTASAAPMAVNRLKQCRSVATRYDRTAESCKAAVTLVSPLEAQHDLNERP
ncbi:hypothetical protein ACFUNF_34200 [Streptomyces sp. NPDC057291]|uniref:hypothetical protein n=1 Tax=Streptomyces sp. NPDC057291 TaxID=3346087 RepID=UPI00363717FE